MTPRDQSDEVYIIDLCDQVLGLTALRLATFDFLRGDARPGKQGTKLLVDAFYPSLNLVIEYRERQHTEAIPIMDRRMTVGGVPRGEQRALYDQRRRDVLPAHGLTLVELSFDHFPCERSKRRVRDPDRDLEVIGRALAHWTAAPAASNPL